MRSARLRRAGLDQDQRFHHIVGALVGFGVGAVLTLTRSERASSRALVSWAAAGSKGSDRLRKRRCCAREFAVDMAMQAFALPPQRKAVLRLLRRSPARSGSPAGLALRPRSKRKRLKPKWPLSAVDPEGVGTGRSRPLLFLPLPSIPGFGPRSRLSRRSRTCGAFGSGRVWRVALRFRRA